MCQTNTVTRNLRYKPVLGKIRGFTRPMLHTLCILAPFGGTSQQQTHNDYLQRSWPFNSDIGRGCNAKSMFASDIAFRPASSRKNSLTSVTKRGTTIERWTLQSERPIECLNVTPHTQDSSSRCPITSKLRNKAMVFHFLMRNIVGLNLWDIPQNSSGGKGGRCWPHGCKMFTGNVPGRDAQYTREEKPCRQAVSCSTHLLK